MASITIDNIYVGSADTQADNQADNINNRQHLVLNPDNTFIQYGSTGLSPKNFTGVNVGATMVLNDGCVYVWDEGNSKFTRVIGNANPYPYLYKSALKMNVQLTYPGVAFLISNIKYGIDAFQNRIPLFNGAFIFHLTYTVAQNGINTNKEAVLWRDSTGVWCGALRGPLFNGDHEQVIDGPSYASSQSYGNDYFPTRDGWNVFPGSGEGLSTANEIKCMNISFDLTTVSLPSSGWTLAMALPNALYNTSQQLTTTCRR